ncbi:orai [Carabus blaptoides fortunei]
MAEIKPFPPRTPSHWTTTPRPKSLILSPEITMSKTRLSPVPSFNAFTPRNSTETALTYAASDISFNDRLSPKTNFSYSGQFQTVHQSKWKFGVNSPGNLTPGYLTPNHKSWRPGNSPGSVTPSTKSMLNYPSNERTINESLHARTSEGLSWRRLHMSRAKLKATATTSELLSGFAMVAMVELQINEPTTVPEWLFVLFAVCTTVLVSVHIFALMISTYILPNIDAISKLEVCELVTESPHERMRGFIELAWAFSTVLGLFLFLVEIAILCWVKFWDYSFPAAIAATVIVIPVLILFVAFAVHFYHSLVVYKCDSTVDDMQKLEDMKKELDQATSPV